MKGIKVLFVLITIFLLSGFSAVFSASEQTPADVRGTIYEDAINSLVKKGIVSGYPDGTYQTDKAINRAEACLMVVKSMNPDEDALLEVTDSYFTDLEGYDWAKNYIDYAVSKGVIKGYPEGEFRPGRDISYDEMVTMLVSALGFKANDLDGQWPNNFMGKAKELGIVSGLSFKGEEKATRGNVALMNYAIADEILKANTLEQLIPGTLDGFTGRAYGIILDKAIVINENNKVVDEIEFLFKDETLHLTANTKDIVISASLGNLLKSGDLFALQMRNGIVQKASNSSDKFAEIGLSADFKDFTKGKWCQVDEIEKGILKFKEEDGTIETKSILGEAAIYVATYDSYGSIDGYQTGTLDDIRPGYHVRLYSVTGDLHGVIEIVIVAEK